MDFLLSAKNDGKDKDIRPVSYPREATSDPFGYLAHQISSCEESKEEGGVIGWIDNPLFQQGNNDGTSKTSTIDHPLLTKDAIQQIFEKQPKGGDVLTVTSTRGVHLLRVKDVLSNVFRVDRIRLLQIVVRYVVFFAILRCSAQLVSCRFFGGSSLYSSSSLHFWCLIHHIYGVLRR